MPIKTRLLENQDEIIREIKRKNNAANKLSICTAIGVPLLYSRKEKMDYNGVLVSIKDTGTGIDPEILPRLFTKFATKSVAGTGLGLFISKLLWKLMGERFGPKTMLMVEDLHFTLAYR